MAIVGLAIAASRPALAQTGFAAADSAAVARAAYRRAGEALQAKDRAAARREIERAATAWPTEEAYPWARAALAAQDGDTAVTLDALRSYAALGLGRDLGASSSLSAFMALPGFTAVRAAHDENRAPLVNSVTRAVIPDTLFRPEGMDADPRTGEYYVASIRHRTIVVVKPNGTPRDLHVRGAGAIGAILGVRVDTARNVLWATTAGLPHMEGFVPGDTTIAALLRIGLRDGVVQRRWDLPPASLGHTLGDLAVGPSGDVFVTDSRDPVLYRLRPGAGTLERYTHPLFESLQGMAPTRDGRVLYLADYSHGLLRVDLVTRTVTRLADAPGSTSLGCDGIALDGDAIIAVQNGVAPARVMRFVLDVRGERIVRAEVLDRNTGVADEPTIGAVVGREFVYVANSQWEKHDDNGVRKAGVRLAPVVLLAVPLGKSAARPK